ncbi:MAG: ribonuclease J [Candidatus Puniceispirillaceae bacterium]
MAINSSELVFVPLGGSGEIGMNANLYHYEGRWLMVDLGISFADETMPGVDVVLPDISFIEEQKGKLEGLILTHAHEDHYGAIPYLWEKLGVPIYGTAFTLALLRRKLAENRADFHIEMHEIDYNVDYQFGPFSVELVALNHSIPDPAALVLRTKEGTILHTGDWKFDDAPQIGTDTDRQRLSEIGKEGVLALIGDSTNAMVEGRTPSEQTARDGLAAEIAKAEGRVAITCFASNVARLDSIIKAAHANQRSVAVVGRALLRTIDAAREVGYLRDVPDFVKESDVGLIPRENLVIICTGSQGEPRAAMARIASGAHETVELQQGDTVIYSSRQIPGNEPAITRIQDMLLRRGIKVVTDDDAPVHVSGHPARDEMSEMYALVRPKIAVPVHGTARHLLAHAELAKSCQVTQTIIPDNGAIISFKDEQAALQGSVRTGALTHEGGEIVDIQSELLRSRRRMLWNGSVSVSIVLNHNGALLMSPSIQQTGLMDDDRGDDFLAMAALRIEDNLASLTKNANKDDAVKQLVISAIRSVAKSMVKRRPNVEVHIIRAGKQDLLA